MGEIEEDTAQAVLVVLAQERHEETVLAVEHDDTGDEPLWPQAIRAGFCTPSRRG
jgi:hypothetical protein